MFLGWLSADLDAAKVMLLPTLLLRFRILCPEFSDEVVSLLFPSSVVGENGGVAFDIANLAAEVFKLPARLRRYHRQRLAGLEDYLVIRSRHLPIYREGRTEPVRLHHAVKRAYTVLWPIRRAANHQIITRRSPKKVRNIPRHDPVTEMTAGQLGTSTIGR